MKSKKDIESARENLIVSVRELAAKYVLPLSMSVVTTEQLYYMALGALATTSFILERESETNFVQMIGALDGIRKQKKRVKKVKRSR